MSDIAKGLEMSPIAVYGVKKLTDDGGGVKGPAENGRNGVVDQN